MINYLTKELLNIFKTLFIDKDKNRVIMQLKSNVKSVVFLHGFNFTLGFEETKFLNNSGIEYVAPHPPQTKFGVRCLYVYASICAPIQVGDVRVPLLRSIWLPNKKENSDSLEIHNINLKHPMYLPINSVSINSIEINIRSDSGALVPFSKSSITSITLHFKKLQK